MSIRTKEQEKIYARKRLIRFNKYVQDYKKDKCCSKCGYNKNTKILCFHHITQKNKLIDVSKIKRNYKQFNEEVKKCIILCPNCHMEKHIKCTP